MVPWLKRKFEDQSGGPRTNLEVLGDEVTFQFTIKYWKMDFLSSSKTRFGETSGEKFRMVRALLPDTRKPSQFQLELQFVPFLQYFQFI